MAFLNKVHIEFLCKWFFNICCGNPWTVFNFIEMKIGVYFFVQVIFKKYDCRLSKQIFCTASCNNSNYARTVSVTSDHALQGLLFHEYVFLMEPFSMNICMTFWIVQHYLKIVYLEVRKSRKQAKMDDQFFLFLSSFTWFLYFVPNILSGIVVWNLILANT